MRTKKELEHWILGIINVGHFNFYGKEELGTVYFNKERDMFTVEYGTLTKTFFLIDETADYIRSLGEDLRIVQEQKD